METGTLVSEPMDAWDEWEPIIHRDPKTSNVFLGTTLRDRYRGYPAPKVGDFGLATVITKDDKRKAKDFAQCGTRFNPAPEQLPVRFSPAEIPTSKTNIWSVGNVVWSLMEGEEGDDRLYWETGRDVLARGAGGRRDPGFSDGARDY